MKERLRPGSRVDVALVGRERWGDENLSLRYLAAALKRSGRRCVILSMNGPQDMGKVARGILATRPAVTGMAVSDSDAAIDSFALASMLRKEAYEGHITCGGVFATLARLEILKRHPEFDSVVRHEGESTLAAMAAACLAGRDPAGIPGLTTRSGDGAPAPVCDRMPLGILPLRKARLPRIMGVPTARLLASRGCPGQCSYCGPSAVQREAVGEALRGGATLEAVRDLGVGAVRRRDMADVADEISILYHERDARFFHFLDDNFLPRDEAQSLRLVRRLADELRRRRVGKMAITLQAPASSLTERLIDELVGIGLVRVLLGVESFDERNAGAFNRVVSSERQLHVMRMLRDRGVVTFFNSLIVHPDSTVSTIESELRALQGVRGALYDTVIVVVHTGSDLWQRLCREGRVDGDILAWRFHSDSRVVERFRAAMLRLKWQGFGRCDATSRVNDLAAGVAIGRRLGLPWASGAVMNKVYELFGECNRLKLHAAAAALEISRLELSSRERKSRMEALLESTRFESDRLHGETGRMEKALLAAASPGGRKSASFFRSCLAAGFTFCLGTAASGCYTSTERNVIQDGVEDVPVDERDMDAERDFIEYEPPPEPVFDPPAYCDDPHSDAVRDPLEWSDPCDPFSGEYGAQWDELEWITADQETCESCISPYGSRCIHIVLDETGRAVDIKIPLDTPSYDAVRRCYLEVLSQYTFPCLGGEEVEFGCSYPLI